MTTEAMRGRLGGMVGRLLDLGASEDGGGSGRLVLTATLDLSPDGSGQPPVFQVLRSAAREVGAGLESRDADALDAEVTALLEAAEDANDRGLLGFVWTSSVDRVARGQDGPLAVLELAAPIRVETAMRRRGSGGDGRHGGGDGVYRAYRLLQGSAMVSYRGERHRRGAPGALGGGDGAPAAAFIRRKDGGIETLASKARFVWNAGDLLVIETAGGGGWGAPLSRTEQISHSE